MEFDYTVTQGIGGTSPMLKLRDGQFLLIRRPDVGVESEAIGVFAGPATVAEMRALESLTPDALPDAASGGPPMSPGAANITVRLRSSGRTVAYSAPIPSSGSVALAKLSAEVRKICERLPALRALRLECLGLSGGNMRVRLSNPGTLAVVLAENPPQLQVVGVPEGGSLEVVSTGPAKVPGNRIAPGGHLEALVPVRFGQKGKWIVRAEYTARGAASPESEHIPGAASSARLSLDI